MLLDDLVSVIDTLKERMRAHGPTLRANETRTRMALIDPLLTALGWDVSDPALVTPEYTVGEGRADYALHGSESIPAAMVEAKRLGHPLNDDERMQMLNYANARGVRYAAVTDGDVWEFYEVFKQAPLEDRRLLSLRIANAPAHETALQLLLLWRPNLALGQPMSARSPILSAQGASDSDLLQTGPAPTQVPEATISGGSWCLLSTVVPKPGDPYPKAIRFADTDEYSTTSWRQVVQHTIHWLWQEDRLKESDLPLASSQKRYIFNTIAFHQNDKPFHTEMSIPGTPFVYEGNVSSRAAVSNAKRLLQHCGVSPDTVQLQIGQ